MEISPALKKFQRCFNSSITKSGPQNLQLVEGGCLPTGAPVDARTMTNGMPVTVAKAAEELRKFRHGLKVNQMGKYKWNQLGIPYTLEDMSPPDSVLVERVCRVFRAAGLQAQ